MTITFKGMDSGQTDSYLEAIHAALEKGMAAKEVVCSITTGFRVIPSMRAAPGLNPYHASVADIGYGFDAVQGTIHRIRQGESLSLVKEMLVFDLDTLGISVKQLSPNFELAVKRANSDVFYLVEQSRYLNHQIGERIKEAIRLGRALLGPEWETIRKRIENIQAIPRL
ncbi:hypothetical protein J6TS1_06940 [Siminovitchia terrae]|uniref:Uncharacterized protein n=1 Tax=Siminovitchia terrae TaxID=1914933 RepID=A0ABQ4KT66_SIMTE|nr:hypothetical protein [Siminovitchia terrae]GIN94824.1 hypothetical protein J6TS1_06940 [Siminovitchia terrae]